MQANTSYQNIFRDSFLAFSLLREVVRVDVLSGTGSFKIQPSHPLNTLESDILPNFSNALIHVYFPCFVTDTLAQLGIHTPSHQACAMSYFCRLRLLVFNHATRWNRSAIFKDRYLLLSGSVL
jgi:hypothetical protein